MDTTPHIAITPVKSSMLDGHGYDAATKTLAVQFKGGHVYHYAGVDQELYAKLQAAESAGKFVNENLKGKFSHTKLPPKKES